MTPFQTIIIAIVEGLTEFLPVSSTAHMSITAWILGISDHFSLAFDMSLQLGAILAVVFLFWRDLLKPQVIKLLIVTTIPTGIIGLLASKWIESWIVMPALIATSLIIGGIILIAVEHLTEYKNKHNTVRSAFWLGVFQGIAAIPGVSRSGAMIVGGKLLGIEKTELFKYTFLASVPTMTLASGYSILKNWEEVLHTNEYVSILIGMFVSFVVAIIVIRFFLNFIRRHDFRIFGYYRIVVGVIILAVLYL